MLLRTGCRSTKICAVPQQPHSNLHKQFAPTLSGCFLLIFKEKEGTICTNYSEIVYANCLGGDMGGCKTYGGGGGNVPENALSRKFLDPSKRASGLLCRGFLYRKNRALTPEGGGKRTVGGGVQNPFLGGVSFVRFSTPLLFPPPRHGIVYANCAFIWVCACLGELRLHDSMNHYLSQPAS